eukprot:jgi/Picsp_1/3129/NSC_05970-R1_predicted protein [Ostreococcus lucimarinus CCE9901]
MHLRGFCYRDTPCARQPEVVPRETGRCSWRQGRGNWRNGWVNRLSGRVELAKRVSSSRSGDVSATPETEKGRLRRRTAVNKSGSNLPGDDVADAVETVESVLLASAVLGHGVAYLKQHKVVADKGPRHSAADATNSLWLTATMVAALLARKLASLVAKRKERASPASQAMLRLRRAEVALQEQQHLMQDALRQLDKIQTRTRLSGRGVKEILREVQDGVAVTGDVLQDVCARMELVEGRVGEAEDLIAAVHDVAAKQFSILTKLIEEQNALRQELRKGNGLEKRAKENGSVRNYHEDIISKEQKAVQSNVKKHSRRSIQNDDDVDAVTDEWGRAVIAENPLADEKNGMRKAHENVPRQDKDGSVVYSFDSN